MDWTIAKERNREALLRILALLFAAVGIARGGAVAMLPRALRLNVLRQLRAAESAVLRLVVIAARGIVLKPRAASAAPKRGAIPRGTGKRAPSFPLIEPLPRDRSGKPRYVPGPGPRISFFDGSDPVIEAAKPEPSPDDPMDATRLCGRLNRLQSVLENLSKHARRFARWQAKRAAAGSGRTRPLRPGRPPGHRARRMYDVDEILRECHELALYALEPVDTS